MEKIIIHENQRGFFFKNGKFIKLLGAGKYYVFGDKEIEVVSLDAPLFSEKCSLDILCANEEIAGQVSIVEVADQQLALHFVNGKFSSALVRGKYAFWTVFDRHEYKTVDISTPEIGEDIPEYILEQLPSSLYMRADVAQYERARLHFNQKLVRILEPGTYYFWKNNIHVEVGKVDTRRTQLNISGQELITQDKVAVRINFVCNYRVMDYVKILTEIDNYLMQIHVAAQLALREYVSRYKLDEILMAKEELAQYVLGRLKEKEKEFFVEITDAGVKDIILPGEIRAIMNSVLVAEKQAQANVITRREEVASTRSLLNTAKLMEENKTLYKLKELEFVEKICANVGSIHLNGNGDVLSQLLGLLGKNVEGKAG